MEGSTFVARTKEHTVPVVGGEGKEEGFDEVVSWMCYIQVEAIRAAKVTVAVVQ